MCIFKGRQARKKMILHSRTTSEEEENSQRLFIFTLLYFSPSCEILHFIYYECILLCECYYIFPHHIPIRYCLGVVSQVGLPHLTKSWAKPIQRAIYKEGRQQVFI